MVRLQAPWRRWGINTMATLAAGTVAFGHAIDCKGFATIEGRVDQGVLHESSCDGLRDSTAEREGFIMGYGGALTLVNGSPYDWVVSSSHSYQMDTWKWPTINAGMIPNQPNSSWADAEQERHPECRSSLAYSDRQRTTQERLTMMSRARRTNSQ